jgi:hypothetical protein
LIILASLATGAILIGLALALGPWFGAGNPSITRFGALAALVLAGVLVYAIAVEATGAFPLRQLAQALRR